MNIKVQCCGIVLIVLLLIVYNSRRRLRLVTSELFQVCCYVTLASLVLDVASIFGIVYRAQLPALLPVLICKTYIAFLALVALMANIYVATSVSLHLPYYRRIITAYLAFGAVVICLIYALPITMHEDAERNLAWTSGPSTIATYVGVFALIVLNLLQIFRHKEYIYSRQREMVVLWMCIWIAAAAIQAVFAQLLIVGFASALGVLLVYIQFENPELYLDKGTGLFNYIAYNRYGEQLYSGSRDFYVIAVVFENQIWQDTVRDSRPKVREKKYDTFLKLQGSAAFRIQENEVLLFFRGEEDKEYAWDTIRTLMKPEYAETLLSHPSFYNVTNTRCVHSPRELLELVRFVSRQKNSAKEGNCHIVDESMAERIVAENATTQMIMEALDEDRIVVYYQPIYSVEEKRFTSAEALVRIVDRDGNLIPPGEFIQVAERNGLIIEIGKRVFEKACNFYQHSQLERLGLEYVEVNLSIVQCVDNRLADDFIRIMERAGIDPRHINLEITESSSLHGKQTLMSNMYRMINYGVNFSLDDFGTGASNLNYIVDMPVKIVKFDRGMIQAYFASGKAKYVMDAAMHMIHGMGLKMVAEGIETEAQYHKMEEIKINYIQGYYFSRPLPEQEFLAFLNGGM